MKKTITHKKYGTIIYKENFFNGKQEVIIDNDELVYEIMGNYAAGVNLKINGEIIAVVPKTKGYEYILYFLPLIIVIIWSSIPSLVKILPVVGGLVGGAISGALSFVLVIFGKSKDSLAFKILISLIGIVVSLLICSLIGSLFVE